MSADEKTQVEVQIVGDASGVPDADRLAHWVQAALTGAGGTVTVRVVGTDEIRTLNRDYRDSDKPTNVLSFPAGKIQGLPAEESEPLGDIVICAEVVSAEASEQGKALEDHWAHMLVHGTLHLLGYDHMTDEEAHDMERLEVGILAAGGVGNPYARQ